MAKTKAKATAKKRSAKTTSAKKAPAKKTPAKKTSAKKAPAKKTPAKKTSAKKTSAKKTPPKKTSAEKAPPNSADTTLAFAFVGAGEAHYFEWAELFVRFRRRPIGERKRAIEAAVPEPLRATIEWDGPMLHLASEQGVGRVINAVYAKRPRPAPALSSANRQTIAARGRTEAFNAAIETFLIDADARAPILLAFRAQDWEAGGTALSSWHRQSVESARELLAQMLAKPVAGDLDLAERLIRWATDEGLRIPRTVLPALRRACEPLVAKRQSAREKAEAKQLAKREREVAAMLKPDAARHDQAEPTQLHSPASLDEALDVLAAHLPKFAEQLRAVPEAERSLRLGASAKTLNALERELPTPLSVVHRALLEAFDGGTVGDVILVGTRAGGSLGSGSIEVMAKALRWWNPVAHTGETHFVLAKKTGVGGEWIHGSIAEDHYEVLRSSPKLDNLLELVAKRRTCVARPGKI